MAGSTVTALPARGAAVRLGDAVAEFLAAGDFLASTSRVYAGTLERLVADLGAGTPVTEITRERLEAHLHASYGPTSPATYNRQVATIGSLFAWCEDRELVVVSPARKLARRKLRRSKTAERQAQGHPPRHPPGLLVQHGDPAAGAGSPRWPTTRPPAPASCSD